MANIGDLAIELLENIASFVRNKKSLAHGALVCRTWKAPFQEYLFECISFNFKPREGLQQLYSLNPDAHPSREKFLKSVRFLHVWDGRAGDWVKHPEYAYDHTPIDMTFLPIFGSLCNLTSICLSQAPFSWEVLSIEETRAVVDFFRRPTLRELTVYATMPQAYFPLVILSLCPNLRSFGLCYGNVQHYGEVFPKFKKNITKLIAEYKAEHMDEDRKENTELVKLALGPVGAIKLQELMLTGPAIPRFLSFANAEENSVVFCGRLTLALLERLDPPTASTDPPDVRGLPLERTLLFQVFCGFGANVTELRFHLSRYHTVTRGVYPTPEALRTLTSIKHLDLGIDIQDVSRDDTDAVANPIQNWFIDFLKSLPNPRQLVHIGIVHRMLVFAEADRGIPGLTLLGTACDKLDRVLSGRNSYIEDCIIILSLHKSGRESRNAFEQIERGVDEQGGRLLPSLFPETHRRCRNFRAFVIADAEYREHISEWMGSISADFYHSHT